MKKMILIIVMLLGITIQSDAQSQANVNLLNELVRIDLPNSTITGGNGTLIVSISVIDMASTLAADPKLVGDVVRTRPIDFGKIFLREMLNDLNDSYYEMGVKTINLYFITQDGKKIYGGTSKIQNPTIDFTM